VVFPSGERIGARVVASVPSADLAMLRLERNPSLTPVAKLGDSDSVQVGDEVFIVGAPLGAANSLTAGHVSARRPAQRTFGGLFRAEFLQTDAAINQGNSGGPMFNLAGEVVGIVSHILSTSSGSQGLGFVVTSNIARELLLDRVSPWTGVDGFRLTEELARVLNVPPPGGLLIQHVARGSLGERLGLRGGTTSVTIEEQSFIVGGDVVLAFQGIRVGEPEQYEQLQVALGRLRAGDLVRVTVLRGGREMQLSTTFMP
jgi:S1-C subfamily serine protease